MKKFIEIIREMSVPREYDKSKIYYHGTSTQKAIDGIIKEGIKPVNITLIKDYKKSIFTPVKDKIYMTPDIKYALIYAFEGDFIGCSPKIKFWKDKEPNGYICVINGKDLIDIQPDEDSVGEMIGNKKIKWLLDKAVKNLSKEKYKKYGYTTLLNAVYGGEADAQTKAGKLILPYLTDEEKLELISNGAHVAHSGTIEPSEIWKIKKADCHLLDKDASNFFKIGEKI